MRHRLRSAVLGLSVLTLAACGSDGPRHDPTTYSDPSSAFGTASAAGTDDFTVTLPAGWKADRERVSANIVAFYTGPTVAGFPVNLSVTREGVGRTDVQAYQRKAVAGLRSALKIKNVTEPAPVQINGEDALRYSFEDTQQGVDLKQGQVVVIHGGKGYVLTYTAPVGEFDANNAGATAIITSLKWH